jgi:hypothetical protein
MSGFNRGPHIALNNDWNQGQGKGGFPVYGNGLFVMLNSDQQSASELIKSSDGINWTTACMTSSLFGSGSFTNVTFANGYFVAISTYIQTSPSYKSGIATSTDGINWTASYITIDSSFQNKYNPSCISYVNNKYVVFYSPYYSNWETDLAARNRTAVSTDLINWTLNKNVYMAPCQRYIQKLVYGIGVYVVCFGLDKNINGGDMAYSYDLLTWNSIFLPPGKDNLTQTKDLLYNSIRSEFVAVVRHGTGNRLATIYKSTDGINWSLSCDVGSAIPSIKGALGYITYLYIVGQENFQGIYFSTGANSVSGADVSGVVIQSYDAINWSISDVPSSYLLNNAGAEAPGGLSGMAFSSNRMIFASFKGFGYPATFTVTFKDWNCFLEGSKVLCLVDEEEKYVEIQNLEKGTLVKTLLNGYKPVEHIGKDQVYNTADKSRVKNRLYKLTTEKYPELTEDLIITGCHSILIDEDLTKEQYEKTMELMGKVCVTEDRYRLMACIDERAEPYEVEGLHTIWHFSLQHHFEDMNYGVYANGTLMVETASKNGMTKYNDFTPMKIEN